MSTYLKIRILLILISKLCITNSSEILVLFPVMFTSHYNMISPLVTELATRGHQITAYTAQSFGLTQNITEHLVNYTVLNDRNVKDFTTLGSGLSLIMEMQGVNLRGASNFLQTQAFKQLMSDEECRYDAIITTSQLVRESLAPLQHKFGALAIELLPHSNSPSPSVLSGIPFNPSYFVDVKLPYTDRMTFMQRLHNLYNVLITLSITFMYTLIRMQELSDEHIKYPGWETRPELSSMISNSSLVLVNSHFSINYPYPLPPNIIDVAGIHIRPSKPLPQNLEDFMSSWAEDGVLLFSWGSMLRGEKADSKDVYDSLIRAFSRLKLGIIWKTNLKECPDDLPDNVFISEWLPQQDILAHKNLRLMVTHGGLSSMIETIHFAVPVVVTPFFFDQGKNARKLVDIGMGVMLEADNISTQSLVWAVQEVAYSNSYRIAAQKQSAIFRDKPSHPLQEAVYWIEYLLNYGDVLRPSFTQMPYYKILLLDVWAFIFIFSIIVIYAIKRSKNLIKINYKLIE
ncbi:UDP-glycosyltransferase UGT4-like [Rhodnius prolixus]|uniref:UDP-glycosyltransferase UGT4-like n=1 Tax=Rhodnius prolixus TaxID=13249 RepID=UPI003D18C3A5